MTRRGKHFRRPVQNGEESPSDRQRSVGMGEVLAVSWPWAHRNEFGDVDSDAQVSEMWGSRMGVGMQV